MTQGRSFITTEDMTQSIPIAPQSLDDVVVEAIDFSLLALHYRQDVFQ